MSLASLHRDFIGRFLRHRVRFSNFHEATDAQALRVYPISISLPHNPSNEDHYGEWDGYCREEPPLSTNNDRFATVVVSLGVKEHHAEKCLVRFAISFFSLVL